MNAQEIRNNAFYGTLNSLIMELAESKTFHDALGIKNKHRSAIYQEMRDAELVLRFFTFRETWQSFRGGMKRNMDSYMEANRDAPPERLETLKTEFQRTLDAVTTIFGEGTYRRWLPEKGVWRRQVIASLFDAQMFACQYISREDLLPLRDLIMGRYQGLFADDQFRRSIDAATNTPTYFKDRIAQMKSLIEEVRG